MKNHFIGIWLVLLPAVIQIAISEDTATTAETTTTTSMVTTTPTTQRTLYRTMTYQQSTLWRYLTFETPGPDFWDDINPHRSKVTSTTTTTPRPTGSTYPPGPDIFQSDFDSSLGGFIYDSAGNFNWTRWTMKCPHQFTGPYADHTTGSGYYMYIDCSEPRVPGMVARLITPELSTLTGCAQITFWYHAWGAHLGRFTVKVAEQPFTKWTTVYELKGPDTSYNQTWKVANVIAPVLRYRVVFEGVVGDGYQGDYAFDDVLIKSIECPLTTPNTTDPNALLYVAHSYTTPAPGGLQGWAIALIVVSIVAAIVAVLLAVWVVYRQKRLREQREREEREEEERRKREMDEDGVIHTDRAYSTRLRSGLAENRPQGKMLTSAQRRMAPGYGARPGSTMGTGYGRMDIPASAISKRGHSPNSALALHQSGHPEYGYDQEGDVTLGQGVGNTYAANYSRDVNTARLRSAARVRNEVANPGDDKLVNLNDSPRGPPPQPPTRLPSIFGGETPPGSANPAGRPVAVDITITEASPLPSRRIDQPASLRPDTPKNQPSGKSEKMGWFD